MTEATVSLAVLALATLFANPSARKALVRALALRDAKAWAAAAVDYRKYLEANPYDQAIWVQLGHALKESGDVVGALAAYSEALRLKEDSDVLLSFGHLYKVMGLWDASISFYRRSAALDGNADAVRELRSFGQQPPEVSPTARTDSAIAGAAPAARLLSIWRGRLKSLFDRWVRRSLARGNYARDHKDWATARERYRAHLDAHPQDFAIWVQFGHVLKEGRQPAQALTAYKTAEAIRPDDADLVLQVGHVYKVLGRPDEARSYYDRAVSLGERRAVAELDALTSLSTTPPIANTQVLARTAIPPSAGPAKVHIVVPLYKAPELVPGLIDSLVAIAEEIRARGATVVLINDSPDHLGLARALDEHVARLRRVAPVEVVTNPHNLGFVGSANSGLQMALQSGADALLLNSDALIAPGSLGELIEVAYSDAMISAVSPRSNNATICNSPYPDYFRTLDHAQALAAHQQLAPFLPRVTYVPTAVGFCLYIKRVMIAEFGLFDTVYGGGYNEENDFLFRCNRRGYRAALANHAYAFHIGSVSFNQSPVTTGQRELENHKILIDRYPEYDRSVTRYFDGIEYKTQRLLSGLVSGGRRRVLFECGNIGQYHAGTFEYMKAVISAFVSQSKFSCYVSCSHASLVFHELDKITGLEFCWGHEADMAPFAAAIRLSQPFTRADLLNLRRLAPVTGFVMLDAIAMDCQYLDDHDLGPIWRQMLETTDMVGYLSEFTRKEFASRFNVPSDVEQFTALCSTAEGEYIITKPHAARRKHILVVGNHYAHKHVYDTIVGLKRAGVSTPIVALGLDAPPDLGITAYKAGDLPQELVDSLYDEAVTMVFPSHYEGFGLPVMHALARSVPVIARRLPVLEEIKRKTERGVNVHLFDTTAEMVAHLSPPPRWIGERSNTEPVQTWASCAADLSQALDRAFARLDYATLARRIARSEV